MSFLISQLQFKRPAGPRNRRSPSRRSRSNSLEDHEDGGKEDQSRNDNASLETAVIPDTRPSPKEPVPKPRVAFLELTNHTENKSSPDASPSNARKPFIPPLDLSTLHEHIDSSGEYRMEGIQLVYLYEWHNLPHWRCLFVRLSIQTNIRRETFDYFRPHPCW